MQGDEHDPLWDLLGRAREPKISAFFSRNVLREIRLAQQEPVGWIARLRLSWRVALPVSAALAVVLISWGTLSKPTPAARHSLEAEIVSNPDYDVINHLDELVASEESALWTESSTN